MNTFSDDGKFAYACWAEDSVSTYLNDKEAQVYFQFLRFSPKFQKRDLRMLCISVWRQEEAMKRTNGVLAATLYSRSTKWSTRTPRDSSIMSFRMQGSVIFIILVQELEIQRKDFRILIFSGDIDTACNFMADDYFMREIAKSNNMEKTSAHQPWFTSETQQEAGFYRTYEAINRRKTKISLHVLTVKGSGHFVPLDRPQASLQMISNFMFPLSGKVNFSRNHDIYANPSVSREF